MVFTEFEVAIEFENGKDLLAHTHRHSPSGDHILAQRGLNSWGQGHRSQFGNPHRAAVAPNTSGKLGTAGEPEAHAFLNEGFGAPSRGAPGCAELQPVVFAVDFPIHGHIPAM